MHCAPRYPPPVSSFRDVTRRPPSQPPRPPPPSVLDMADHSVPSQTTSGAPTSSLRNLLSGQTAAFVSLSSCLPSHSPPYRPDPRVTHVNALKTRSQAHQALVTRPLRIHAIPDRCSVVTWPLLCGGCQPPYKTHLHLDHLPRVPLGPPSTPTPEPCPTFSALCPRHSSSRWGHGPAPRNPAGPHVDTQGTLRSPNPNPWPHKHGQNFWRDCPHTALRFLLHPLAAWPLPSLSK